MFSKKFWQSLRTWEKVLLYVTVIPFILLRITINFIIIPFAHWSWEKMKLCWYWTKIAYRRAIEWFRWVRTSPVGRKHFRRIVTSCLTGLLAISVVVCLICIRNNAEDCEVEEALDNMYTIEYHVVSGDSWWSIAYENCPSYMVVGGNRATLDYLELLYSFNEKLAEKEYLHIGDVVTIPIMPD